MDQTDPEFESATLHKTIVASSTDPIEYGSATLIRIKQLTEDLLLYGIIHRYGKEIRTASSQSPNLSPELLIFVAKGPVLFNSPLKR
jgi:hypothetical protein